MLIQADARHIPLKSESVQCVVTSPPYWGLRDYSKCECCKGGKPNLNCEICSGLGILEWMRPQIGLESTPEIYVAEIVAVFREVWRVLKSTGTCWINLGDSYNAHPGQRTEHDKAGWKQATDRGSCETASRNTRSLKPKDLVGIPWRVAFALQADGWWWRSCIPWLKRNSMPESTKDRPSSAVEYIMLFAKSESYFYDYDAVKLPAAEASGPRLARAHAGYAPPGQSAHSGVVAPRPRSDKQRGHSRRHAGFNDRWDQMTKEEQQGNGRARRNSDWFFQSMLMDECGDPLASVASITGYAGAHFATFPRALIEPMILAGSRPGDIVLDPFAGSGTSVMVARSLGRVGIGIDLGYQDLAKDRIHGPLFASTVNR